MEFRIGADMNLHREAFGELGEAAEEPAPIVVRAEDATAVMASVDDMVPAMGHPDAKGSSHGGFVPTRPKLSIL